MGIEFNILKDLATINNTAVELASINRILKSHVSNPVFITDYDALVGDIARCYKVVINNLEPLVVLQTAAEFEAAFAQEYQGYIERYLSEISRPREYAEMVYLKNLQFWKHKEVKTGFPLLARNYARLHEIIDKWLDNDIWLALTIDSLFKLLARLLNEVNEVFSKDPEDAFLLFQGGVAGLAAYLSILKQQVELLPSTD